MIGFLPPIYKDELCSSWLARYYVYTGYKTYTYALRDFYGTANAQDYRFIGMLREDVKAIVKQTMNPEELILQHTMLPLYRFMKPAEFKQFFYSFCNKKREDSQDAVRRISNKNYMFRYCPVCAAEDRETYGEAYWHRSANIPGLHVCIRHGCRLAVPDIRMHTGRTKRARLFAAELEIPYPEQRKDTNIDAAREVSDFETYLAQVFYAPIDIEQNVSASELLVSRLEGTKYVSRSGKKRNLIPLYNDFNEFYSNYPWLGKLNLRKIEDCIHGRSSEFIRNCQLGNFLGISAMELTHPLLPEKTQAERFSEEVKELYDTGITDNWIASILGTSYGSVLRSRTETSKQQKISEKRRRRSSIDWKPVDRELLTRVEEACRNIYGGGQTRPGKVSRSKIERLLQLPRNRLLLLPRCMEVVKEFSESYEEFWARSLIWAYRQCLSERAALPISGNQIFKKVFLRKEQFIRAERYLDKFGTEEEADGVCNIYR